MEISNPNLLSAIRLMRADRSKEPLFFEALHQAKLLCPVQVNGESLLAELHWYEEPSTGRVEFKIKPQPGGEFFIYEN